MPVLLAAADLSFGEQATGGVPFFNDEGELTLPRESLEELEESMPELEVFRRQEKALAAPLLPSDLDDPMCGNGAA